MSLDLLIFKELHIEIMRFAPLLFNEKRKVRFGLLGGKGLELLFRFAKWTG